MRNKVIKDIYKSICRRDIKVEYLGNDKYSFKYRSGFKSWWLDEKRHREDGPAVIFIDGTEEWYLNGRYLTKEKFDERVND